MVSDALVGWWFVVVYFSPFIQRALYNSDTDLGPRAAMLPLIISIAFPLLMLVIADYMEFNAMLITLLFLLFFAMFWSLVFMGWALNRDDESFTPFIVMMYLPSAAFAFYLAMKDILPLLLLLAFLMPPAGYVIFNRKDTGYILFTIPPLFFIFLGLHSEAILSSGALLLISLLYLFYRYITHGRREITFGDSRRGEIETPPIKRRPKGFSVVNPKSYPAIPKDAIDPFTHENIHDSIAGGKRIVKCRDCGAYYDEDVWKYYGKTCARDGCSNAGV
ncbi:MAG: hypothetical protein A7316_04110 [Candidatus Altiarchaeales archaeon WOR_SM1_86-2]|nr:MAG: hypothetical protein A7316_04110 [Candidatus Altiarchaeales archaeon WOR_SM1_86-2]ODS40008.1 MAG: hypothetical protein A7315_09885 [Candidatus Altiarchaeales archaeon WOR_SM1_79]